MTEPSKMRRHLVAALSITAIFTIVPAAASQAEAIGYHAQVPATICSFDWQKGTWQVKELIRCAALYWKVPGGPEMALSIADRESKFAPNTCSGTGPDAPPRSGSPDGPPSTHAPTSS